MTGLSAKELFLEYSGSRYEMERSGRYDEYLSHRVSKQQELQWSQERRLELMQQLQAQPFASPIFHEMIALIANQKDVVGVREFNAWLLTNHGDLDQFSVIRFSEDLEKLCQSFAKQESPEQTLIDETHELILKLLDWCEQSDFWVADFYLDQPHLVGVTSKPRVLQRAAKLKLRLAG